MGGPGIDYGMGRTNVDRATGIRYGVISQAAVLQAWADSAQADYGKPTCPKCGNEAEDYNDDVAGQWDAPQTSTGFKCADFMCRACEAVYDSSDCYSEEPIGWNYEGDGYVLTDCLDSNIMVLKSPYYTLGAYCSPCVPGAVSLESPIADGAKAYCLGHDWFEDGRAPYPVYSVATGKEVIPESAS